MNCVSAAGKTSQSDTLLLRIIMRWGLTPFAGDGYTPPS